MKITDMLANRYFCWRSWTNENSSVEPSIELEYSSTISTVCHRGRLLVCTKMSLMNRNDLSSVGTEVAAASGRGR